MAATHKLPKVISLGPTQAIRVAFVSPDKLRAILREPEAENVACWDDLTDTIYIIHNLTPERQWKALRHELAHALTDIICREAGGI